jgi:hypothetical protein
MKQYRYPPKLKEKLQKEIDKLMESIRIIIIIIIIKNN